MPRIPQTDPTGQDGLSDLLRQTIVRIDIEGEFSGTGFFVGPRRLLTCAHVTQRRGKLFPEADIEWQGYRAKAAVIRRFPDLDELDDAVAFWPFPDLALLEVTQAGDQQTEDPFSRHSCPVLDFGQPHYAPSRDELYAIGYSKDVHTRGAIAETPAPLRLDGPLVEADATYLQLDEGDVLHGMSGGPVLNLRTGAVCGVTESRRRGERNGGFMVPFFAIPKEAADLILPQNRKFHEIDGRFAAARRNSLGLNAVRARNPHVHLGSVPLCARLAELKTLSDWLERGQSKLHCQTGPGGQGKSALVWTFFEALRSRSSPSPLKLFWHGFAAGGSHYEGLREILEELDCPEGSDPDLSAPALEGSLVILDGLDSLFGASGQLLDILSFPQRTISDPGIEALIRQILDHPNSRVLATARLKPALFDDPYLARATTYSELKPLETSDANLLWESLGVTGGESDLSTATAFLRGSPLLIRLASRRMTARGAGGSVRSWLDTNARFLETLSTDPQYQKAVSAHLFVNLTPAAELALAVLAAFAQHVSIDEWRSAASALNEVRSHEGAGRAPDWFDVAVGEILELGLASRGAGDLYEMHELTAEMFLQSQPKSVADAAYAAVDEHYGPELRVGRFYGDVDYQESVMPIESVLELRRAIGRYKSLVRRGALNDAADLFSAKILQPLRFKLGELRLQGSLISQITAAHLQQTGTLKGAPLSWHAAELAGFAGRPAEALALSLEDAGDGETLGIRATAYFALGRTPEAYRTAQRAMYRTWRDDIGILHRDYEAFQIMAKAPEHHRAPILISNALSHRNMALGILGAGYHRASLLFACEALRIVHDSNQPGVRSMVFEMVGRVLMELGDLEGAEEACAMAADMASELQVREHILAAEVLQIELRSRRPAVPELADEAEALLSATLSAGFSLFAKRCLDVLERIEPDSRRPIVRTAIGQLRHLASGSAPTGGPRQMDLAEEFRELASFRESGRCREYALLCDGVWQDDEALGPARGAAGRLFDQESVASLLDRLRRDSELARAARTMLGEAQVDQAPQLHSALSELELSEERAHALNQVLRHWRTQLDPAEAYELLAAAYLYYPDHDGLQCEMIESADRAGRAYHAYRLIQRLLRKEISCSHQCRGLASLYRRARRFDLASLWSSETFCFHMIFYPSDRECVSNALRFCFDAQIGGMPAADAIAAMATLLAQGGHRLVPGMVWNLLELVGSEGSHLDIADQHSVLKAQVEALASRDAKLEGPMAHINALCRQAFLDSKSRETEDRKPDREKAIALLKPELLFPEPGHSAFAQELRKQIGL